jgi:hypothetical protein
MPAPVGVELPSCASTTGPIAGPWTPPFSATLTRVAAATSTAPATDGLVVDPALLCTPDPALPGTASDLPPASPLPVDPTSSCPTVVHAADSVGLTTPTALASGMTVSPAGSVAAGTCAADVPVPGPEACPPTGVGSCAAATEAVAPSEPPSAPVLPPVLVLPAASVLPAAPVLAAVPALPAAPAPLTTVDVPPVTVAVAPDAGVPVQFLHAVRPQRTSGATRTQDSRPAEVATAGTAVDVAPPSGEGPAPVPLQSPDSQPPLPPPPPPTPNGSINCAGARASDGQQTKGAGGGLPVMTLVATNDVDIAGSVGRPDTRCTGRVLDGSQDPGFAPD